jgi:hypothetical protein
MSLGREEIANLILRFLAGSVEPYEWDDFISVPQADPDLEAVRRTCVSLREEHPSSDHPREYCNAQGIELLEELARQLRGRAV